MAKSSESLAHRHRANYQQQVRIIGGQWKRTPLAIPDGAGARPSLSRVRTVLFDWLNFLLKENWQDLNCLDLFAGSGALGFEAASRGAMTVDLWEKEPRLVVAMQRVAAKVNATQLQIVQTDSLAALSHAIKRDKKWNMVFCDPPFGGNYYAKILPLLSHLIHEDGFLYCESDAPLNLSLIPAFRVERQSRIGSVHFFLLRKTPVGAEFMGASPISV